MAGWSHLYRQTKRAGSRDCIATKFSIPRPEVSFDRVAKLAALWFKVPIALVSLIDENRQWFKSCIGVEVKETERDLAFCAHAILQNDALIVPDASKDARFKGNPLVTGEMHIRFYAGAPLITADGLRMGTLCVIDREPHYLTENDCHVLATLAALVVDEMDLRLARMKAEEEIDKKSQYITYMSHEVRTPLHTIRSALALAQNKPGDEDTKGYLTLISNASDILMETINDFLDIVQLETKAMELEAIPFRPLLLIEQVASLIRPWLHSGVTLKLDNEGLNDIVLKGDPTRLRQILINFASNAAKFTEMGQIVIHSSGFLVSPGKLKLRFDVTDSGIGIAPEKLPKLFKKFQQVETGTARQYGGSGLGLHICKNLAELMGGHVGAVSVPDQGSRFWFEAVFDMAPIPQTEVPRLVHTSSVPSRILLVEDNRTNQALISELLKMNGHVVTSALDGNEAIEKAKQEQFDIILMDCHMPEMDGFEATRALRNDSASLNQATAIVALTANTEKTSKDRCLASGMNGFLVKPVTIDALQQAIDQFVKHNNH